MNEPNEIQAIGRLTREWIVDSGACPLLRMHGITTVGISEAAHGFRFVRKMPVMSVLMASIRGRGKAYVDGKYRIFPPDTVLLMPCGVLHGYESTGREKWRTCWVCYEQPREAPPLICNAKPMLVRAAGKPLEEAIAGLYCETVTQASAPIQKLYVDLIHEHSMRIASAIPTDNRLSALWAMAESDLARRWTLEQLAEDAGMSIESLRVLSKRTTGRSPMQQVTFLKMQRAATVLASSDAKLSVIAYEVGYADVFAFSVTFKRHIGVSPGAYRAQRRSRSIHWNGNLQSIVVC